MREWKELKDKEVIIGLIIIIVLGVVALSLLIRREIRYQKKNPITMEESSELSEGLLEEDMTEDTVVTEVAGQTVAEEKEQEEAIDESNTEEEVVLANIRVVTQETGKQIADNRKSEIGLYDILGEERYVYYSLTERKQDDGQLKELFEYWDAYKLDAVADLVRLERLQKISEELKGTRNFYYYGSVDRLGRPSGKGLAVYADNTYYCGEWKEGLRHGKGMWLEVAIYTEENKNQNLGVIEHSYNGQWSKDLPNGEGQEHFSYDYSVMKPEKLKDSKCIANIIGQFKDGYYNGEMYIMTVDAAGNTTDWSGTCREGVWEPIMKGSHTDSVWESYEKDASGNPMFHYLYPKDNNNYGIMGLKK